VAERRGRPPVPTEVKRRRGTARPDRVPDEATVVHLPMAEGVPEPSVELGLEGKRLWERVWNTAITWISPHSDMTAVEQACLLADDVAVARKRYQATSDPADARALRTLGDALGVALSDLGFNPTARTKLGVAEVTRVSKLEALKQRAKG
jgi:hypothetical protein